MAEERLTTSLAENLITLLAHNDQFGRLVYGMVQADLFDNDVHRTIVARTMEYWSKHGRSPGKQHTPDLFADILEDATNRRAPAYRSMLLGMVALTDSGVNAAYVLDQLQSFLRLQAFKRAVLESAERLTSREHLAIEEIEQMWSKLLAARQVQFEPGLRLSDYSKVIEYLRSRTAGEFTTGIKPLDKAGVVPSRGATFLFLAPPGYGKTWFAVNCGKRAFRDRKKVLHISLEMRMELVLERYYQALLGVPRHKADVKMTTTLIKRDQFERFEGLDVQKVDPKFHLASPDAEGELEAHLNWYGTRLDDLIVKSFPPRSLTMAQLEAYLDQLELFERFVPDLLIIDYFGVTKTDPKDHRISLGRAFEDFRGILVKRNMAGVAPHQINRQGAGARNVLVTQVAEDFSLIATTDIAVTMSATADERTKGLARLWVAKAREEKDQFGVLITQNYPMGQFCIDAIKLDPAYNEYYTDNIAAKSNRREKEEEDDDEVDDD